VQVSVLSLEQESVQESVQELELLPVEVQVDKQVLV
jgi:hypothetical protein